MIRVLAPEPLTDARGLIGLDDDEAHHLKVRRAGDGDQVEILDGRGRIGAGRLQNRGKAWSVEVESVRFVPAPADLILLVGGGDKDRFAWLVEKAVELGVTRIVPLDTERSRHVASRIRDEHRARLELRAAEALKQCGGAWALDVGRLAGVEAGVKSITAPARWLADPAGPTPLAGGADLAVAIAVGPEGGFTAAESEVIHAAGFVPTGLGGRILRFETAAVAAAVLAGIGRKGRP